MVKDGNIFQPQSLQKTNPSLTDGININPLLMDDITLYVSHIYINLCHISYIRIENMANVLTATQKYEDEDSFTNLLARLAITPTQRQRLNIDGFTTMKSLVQHYRTLGPKQFKTYLKDLKKTFAICVYSSTTCVL